MHKMHNPPNRAEIFSKPQSTPLDYKEKTNRLTGNFCQTQRARQQEQCDSRKPDSGLRMFSILRNTGCRRYSLTTLETTSSFENYSNKITFFIFMTTTKKYKDQTDREKKLTLPDVTND